MNGKLEEHLQNIGDLIEIQDKIVTYKWISKVLKVHTNTAKQLLYAYTSKSKESDNLLITYVVAGIIEDGESLNFCLVEGNNLERTKKKFRHISSIHVYSIQKGKSGLGADIYNADSSFKITSDDLRFCSIQPNDDIYKRDNLKTPISSQNESSSSSSSRAVPEKEKKADPIKRTSPKKPDKAKKEEPVKRTSPRKLDKKQGANSKGNSINNLFSKQAAKKKVDTEVTESKESVKKDLDKPLEKKQGQHSKEVGISALFKKQSSTNKVETPVKTENKENTKDNGLKVESPQETKTPIADNKDKSQSKKKRKKSSKNIEDSAGKRRKRIKIASESESEGDSDGNERFPSPEPEPEAVSIPVESEDEDIIPITPLEKGRKRVRKLIDRTFTDEEGYIVTKKEYVFESCSDDDVESNVKENGKSPKKAASVVEAPMEIDNLSPPKIQATKGAKSGKAKNKATAKSPKKQPSITNYFKKS